MKKIIAICLILIVMPTIALAATNPCAPDRTTTTATSSSEPPPIGNCVSQIYLWALGIAGILALFMIVIGGYLVITASGNAAQASKGKSYIYFPQLSVFSFYCPPILS